VRGVALEERGQLAAQVAADGGGEEGHIGDEGHSVVFGRFGVGLNEPAV
jgi:hypothetical protein